MSIISLSTVTSGITWTVVGGEGTTGLIGGICSIMSFHWNKTQDWLHIVSHSSIKQTKTYMHIKVCLPKSRGSCRTRGECYLMWLLGYSWRGDSISGNTRSWHMGRPLLFCLSFETWLLPKGRHREGEGDRMDDYFCMARSPKVWQ
jgi:hypothetical protein